MRGRVRSLLASGSVVSLVATLVVALPSAADPSVPEMEDGLAELGSPELFEPEPVELEGVAGRSGEPGAPDGEASELERVGELVEERTVESATYELSDGTFETVISAGPMHASVDGEETLVPIDTTLVEADEGGFEPEVVDYTAVLPAEGDGPLRVGVDDVWVEVQLLEGALSAQQRRAPAAARASEDELEAAPAEAEVEGATAVYEEVLPAVEVEVTALPDGIKEHVVLAGPSAPRVLVWEMSVSPGLVPVVEPGGQILFENEDGEAELVVPAPFMFDASGTEEETLTNDIEVDLEPADGGSWHYRLTLSDAWLDAPERQWPVTVDPTVVTSPFYDCMIFEGSPTTNYCGASAMRVGVTNGGAKRRSVLDFDIVEHLAIARGFRPVDVMSAELSVKLTGDSDPFVPTHIYPLGQPFNDHATWQQRTANQSWTRPGAIALSAQPVPRSTGGLAGVSGGVWRSDPARRYWYPTQLVQEWFDYVLNDSPQHGRREFGFAMRAVNEAAVGQYRFHSSEASRWQDYPQLKLQWAAGTGQRSGANFVAETSITDRSMYKVDVGSQNLLVQATDLSLNGIAGHDMTVDRAYNSMRYSANEPVAESLGVFGLGWTSTLDSTNRLKFYGDQNRMVYTHPSGAVTALYRTADDKYISFRYTDLEGEAVGNQTRITNRRTGLEERFDGQGRLLRQTDRAGNRIDYGYQGGRIVFVTDGRMAYAVTYNAAGRVTRIQDSGNREWAYTYSGNLLTSMTDPTGATTTYGYTNNRLTSIRDPEGGTHRFEHDSLYHVLTTLTRPEGGVTRFDEAVRGSQDPPTALYAVQVRDANNRTTRYSLDRRGRVRQVIDARGNTQSVDYDVSDNVASYTDRAGGTPVQNAYSDGNLTRSETPGGSVYQFTYDNEHNAYSPGEYINPQGNTTTYDYREADGNLETIKDATNGTVELGRDGKGRVTRVTNPRGFAVRYLYDTTYEVLTTIRFQGNRGDVTYTYDSLYRPITMTDGRGVVTHYGYDANDRQLVTLIENEHYSQMSFDGNGRQWARGDNVSGAVFTVHDRDSRITEEIYPAPRGTITYTYDPVGNLTSMTDATGTTGYRYNTVNMVTHVDEPGGTTVQYAYQADTNLLASRTLPTSPVVVESYRYNDDNQIIDIDVRRDGNRIARQRYDYDRNSGPLLDQAISNIGGNIQTTDYAYDTLDRLTQAAISTGITHHFTYDEASNRRSHAITQGNTTDTTWYGYDRDDKRCWASTGAAGTGNCAAPAGATRFTYDADGRLTSSTDGRSFTYNAAGQTVEMTTPEGGPLSASYQMDTQNERVTAGNATFASSLLGLTGQQVGTTRTAWLRDPDGNLLGQRIGSSRSYYLTDQLGSIIAVIDHTGQIRNSYRYTPDGEDTETCHGTGGCISNPWRFAGEFQDTTTGLYKIGARYYQPDQATWTTPDPIQHRINPAQPGETNPYAYAGSNPINYTDPTGAFIDVFAIADYAQLAAAIVSLLGFVALNSLAMALGCTVGGLIGCIAVAPSVAAAIAASLVGIPAIYQAMRE